MGRRVHFFRHAGRGLLVLAMVGGSGGAANALEISIGLGYSLEYTDNARLASTNKQEEWIDVVFGEIQLSEKSVNLDAQLKTHVARKDYRKNIFDDETVGSLNGILNWHIVPGQFDWIVENFYTQTAINPNAPDTPTNRQGSNVFTTGPDVTLRLAPVHSLKLGARYTDNTYRNVELDSTRKYGIVGWIYQVSPQTTFSLNGTAESVDFDNEQTNTNFDRKDLYAQILHSISRNQILLEGGTTRVERVNQPKLDNGRYRFSWTRELTPASILKLSTSSEVSDVTREALAVGGGTVILDPILTGGLVTSDVFEAVKHEVEYTYRRATSTNTIGLFKHEDDFKTKIKVEERRGGHLIFGYDFTSAFSGELFGNYRSTRSLDGTTLLQYRDVIYGVRILNNLTRNFRITLEYKRNERKDVDPTKDYTENRGMITLTYFITPTLRRLQ